MQTAVAGLFWAFAFVFLEAVQFVFFGHIFQEISSFLFGFLVIGITTVAFVGASALRTPGELRTAFVNFRLLVIVNVIATISWISFLLAVQLIEPAIAYTVGAGAMPLTAYLAYRFGVAEGEDMRNRAESTGNILILLSMIFLTAITIFGYSGFVRGGAISASIGVLLAFGEGILFTFLLIYCQRLDRVGVGPGTVFGLRFPLYVVASGALAAAGLDHKADLSLGHIVVIVLIGLLLIVPPLYALQRAVALISTLTLSALTALGPFMIFGMQVIEGRVDYATATLFGLVIYFAGALLAAFGAVRATVGNAK